MLPWRYIVKSREEIINIINNANNGSVNVFFSVYSFRGLLDNGKIDRRTARLRWVFFDLDKDEGWHIDKYKEVCDLIPYKHILSGSGTGAHLYVLTDYNPNETFSYPNDAIANFQREFMSKFPSLGFCSSRTYVGNLSMLARMPFTINPKCKNKALPYNPYTFKKINKFIPREGDLLKLNKYDKQISSQHILYREYAMIRDVDVDVEKIRNKLDLPYLPPCIEAMISRKMGFTQRQYLAAALRDAGYIYERAIEVFRYLLEGTIHDEGGSYFSHFMREGILKWVYNEQNPFVVRCIDLARKGLCSSCPEDERNMYRKRMLESNKHRDDTLEGSDVI